MGKNAKKGDCNGSRKLKSRRRKRRNRKGRNDGARGGLRVDERGEALEEKEDAEKEKKEV